MARLERLERSLGLPDKKFLAHLMREADREAPARNCRCAERQCRDGQIRAPLHPYL